MISVNVKKKKKNRINYSRKKVLEKIFYFKDFFFSSNKINTLLE